MDAALRQVADEHAGVEFVSFPSWDTDGTTLRRAFSFRAMHRGWALAVAARLAAVLPGAGPDPATGVVPEAELITREAVVGPDGDGASVTLVA